MKVREGYKKCSTCGRIFKATTKRFYSDVYKTDGLSTSCKECQKSYVADYYEDHKEYYSKYNTLTAKFNKGKVPYGQYLDGVLKLKETYGVGSNSRSVI